MLEGMPCSYWVLPLTIECYLIGGGGKKASSKFYADIGLQHRVGSNFSTDAKGSKIKGYYSSKDARSIRTKFAAGFSFYIR